MNQNAATTIAALLVLNAGLFVSNHARDMRAHAATRAEVVSAKSEACKARMEARAAALKARIEARQAARDAVRARRDARNEALRVIRFAPATSTANPRVSLTDYVHCIVNSGVRSLVGSN